MGKIYKFVDKDGRPTHTVERHDAQSFRWHAPDRPYPIPRGWVWIGAAMASWALVVVAIAAIVGIAQLAAVIF